MSTYIILLVLLCIPLPLAFPQRPFFFPPPPSPPNQPPFRPVGQFPTFQAPLPSFQAPLPSFQAPLPSFRAPLPSFQAPRIIPFPDSRPVQVVPQEIPRHNPFDVFNSVINFGSVRQEVAGSG